MTDPVASVAVVDDAHVPASLAARVDELLELAADRGHVLSRPVLERTRRASRGTHALAGDEGPGRIVLGGDVLTAPPAVQSWVLAHELGHLHPDSTRPRALDRSTVAALLAGGAGVVIWLLLTVAAMLGAWGPYGAALATLVGLFILTLTCVGLVLFMFHLMRRQETHVDAIAAAVFGQVLPADGVAWLRLAEGRIARALPTLLRSHPRPARRRLTGLDALG